jgi:UDP-N-acetylglucosamine acyltransferase
VLREYVTVNRGTVTSRAVTRVGSDNMLLAYSGRGCVLGNHCAVNLVMWPTRRSG